MRKELQRVGIALAIATATANCTDGGQADRTQCLMPPPPKGTPIAQIGNVSLTIEQITKRIHDQGVGAIRRYGSPEQARAFIEDQVRFELLALAAFDDRQVPASAVAIVGEGDAVGACGD